MTKFRHTDVHNISDRTLVPVICEAIIFLVDSVSSPASNALAKFRKATISCVMSVRLSVLRPSVRPHEHLGCHSTDWPEILRLSIFRKLFDKIQVLLDSDKNNGLLI
jgi:hypothetical protein